MAGSETIGGGRYRMGTCAHGRRHDPSQSRQYRAVESSIPKVSITLLRADAIVLFDWLMSTDLNAVPSDHPAVKQALTDLLTRLETETDVPYGVSGTGLTQQEIDAARAEVARHMG